MPVVRGKYPWLWLCGVLSACSVYDAQLIEPPHSSANPTLAANDGVPAAISSTNAGGAAANSRAANGGGASGDTAYASDAGAAVSCGNGRLDPGETCDTAIVAGAPGACPSSCTSSDPCTRMVASGTQCSAQCQELAPISACQSGDGCCPAQCDHGTDADCSPACGDGVIEAERGETCETGAGVAMNLLCPTAQACDDGDPCTQDALSGSAANCNALCTHKPIPASPAADGCCPAGANANSDADCKPVCGNGVREPGEACDGTTGCNSACQQTLSGDQIACIDQLATDSCTRCQCTSCTQPMLACRASGDAARDQACAAVEDCATAQSCAVQGCYCGSDTAITLCGLAADGPCKTVIESAAGTIDPFGVQAAYLDANSALGRAGTLGDCRRQKCAEQCP